MPHQQNRQLPRPQGNRHRALQNGEGGNQEFSGPIPSPYNFVPLSDHVVFPEWSHLVSQDVPFKDGLRGHIDIDIEAVTPIYIRNGGDHPETPERKRNNKEYQDFFKIEPADVGYAIPGTSIKGVIRSVFEIVSFSRLTRMADRHLAYRDLQNQKLFTSRLTRRLPDPAGSGTELWEPKAQAGFLREDGGRWILQPCQSSRVSHSALLEAFGWSAPQGKRNESVSAEKKYLQWGQGRSLEIAFKKNAPEMRGGKFYYRLATEVGTGPDRGTLVFTGQPNPRKTKEFVFHDSEPHEWDVTVLKKQFRESHTVGEKLSESWAYWHPRLRSGRKIPVFFLPDDNGAPTSIGLAQMYRLPFTKTLVEAIPESHTDDPQWDRLDFAETLLGYVASGASRALRGRVAFQAAKSFYPPQTPRSLKTTVLGRPKPSFYPNYVDQAKVRDPSANDGRVRKAAVKGVRNEYPDFQTLNDSNVRLRGWKRYPVHNPAVVGDVPEPPTNPENQINWDTVSSFLPLPAGTRFQGRISFHNLLPVELGGLLWALEWGGDSALCHSVGMAKPFGFGSIRIRAKLSELRRNDSKQEIASHNSAAYRKIFEDFMQIQLKTTEATWRDSPQLRELLAIADPKKTAKQVDLAYPTLHPDRRINHFSDIKKAGAFLLPYSELVRRNPKNHVSPVETFARLEETKAAQIPIAKGDNVESTGAELRTNKRGKQSWRILFQENGEKLEGLLSDKAKSQIPAGFGPDARYRFKIASFSEADYKQNILLDFAEDPPRPLP